MKILILNWRDPSHPLAGGAEISLIEQAKIWHRKGFAITWFSSSFEGAKKEERTQGIHFVRKGSHYSVVPIFVAEYLKGRYRDFDVYVDCFHFIPFFTPLFIRKKKIVGLINEIAGKIWFDNLFYPFAFIGFVAEPFIIRLYKGYNFITGSESAKKDVVTAGIDEKRIFVVHHGFNKLPKVDVKKANIPTLIFIGRVSQDKGAIDLLKVIGKIVESGLEIKCNIVGKFENKNFESKFRNIIAELKIAKYVKIYGFVSEKKKAELIKDSWLLVHPSKKEGWGLNVIEANSLGTPAVGYKVEGLVDSIVDGRTGVLVEPSIECLAEGIINLVKDPTKIGRLGLEAKKWSKEFSWQKAGEQSLQILNL